MSNFNEYEALGAIKEYPMRRLRRNFLPSPIDFIKPIDEEAKTYDEESDALLESWIQRTERDLMTNIPF